MTKKELKADIDALRWEIAQLHARISILEARPSPPILPPWTPIGPATCEPWVSDGTMITAKYQAPQLAPHIDYNVYN